jgi:hypothetical protein
MTPVRESTWGAAAGDRFPLGRWRGLVLFLLCFAGAPCRADAQLRTVANLVVGDAVVVLKVGTDKQVYIGIGTDAHTSTVTVSATAVDEFVAESEVIVRLAGRRIPTTTPDRPVLQEGETGRALSVTRHLERAHGTTEVSYHFFVSDDRLTGYAVPATTAETKAFLLALHRAARAANGVSSAAPHVGATPKH